MRPLQPAQNSDVATALSDAWFYVYRVIWLAGALASPLDYAIEARFFKRLPRVIGGIDVSVRPDLHVIVMIRSRRHDDRGKPLLMEDRCHRKRVGLARERGHLQQNRAVRQ